MAKSSNRMPHASVHKKELKNVVELINTEINLEIFIALALAM